MVKTIEEYTAEISKSSEGARNALQNQINAIEGNLAQTNKQINENYANQQINLNNQSNRAASAASIQAAANGTGAGGAANIANKKYYEQIFVPAQIQLNTNKSQALENAQSQANSNRLSLEGQLASLEDENRKLALQRYYDELERERQEAARQEQLELERQRIAASRSYGYGYGGGGGNTSNGRYGKGYSFDLDDGNGWYFTDANGNFIKAQQYANNHGRDIRDYLNEMAGQGDMNAVRALAGLNNGRELTAEEEVAFDVLGMNRSGYGRRA